LIQSCSKVDGFEDEGGGNLGAHELGVVAETEEIHVRMMFPEQESQNGTALQYSQSINLSILQRLATWKKVENAIIAETSQLAANHVPRSIGSKEQ
jgi:hypothetical protein